MTILPVIIASGLPITLHGSVSDPEGDSLVYDWGIPCSFSPTVSAACYPGYSRSQSIGTSSSMDHRTGEITIATMAGFYVYVQKATSCRVGSTLVGLG